ncbi:amidase [Acinetobacter sp. B51(2017)]|uniref:amidase n=1 Tax=Acinetobacter sp. B51(2017) TaxID=2060938 RepID=UPI0013E06F7D|nr:amidase [Acinetobacter sp. B51(2017)]
MIKNKLPSFMKHYSDLSALDLGQAIRTGQSTAVELSQYFLQRIQEHTELNCISQVLSERALHYAAHLDQLAAQGVYLSSLHGVPIIVKDSFAVAGEITWAGTRYLNQLEQQDAAIICQLEALGLVVIARAKMTELAFGLSGQNPMQGTPCNPYYPLSDEVQRAPGGSSSGCAVALAAGLAPLAIGGDTGGSVRVPAALNGILGFKPSHERLRGQGNVPLAPSLDSVGLMAKSTADLHELYRLMQPKSPVLAATTQQTTLFYLQEQHFPEPLQPEVHAVWQHHLQQLHAQGYALVPWQPPANLNFQQLSEWCSDIIAYEGYQQHGHWAEDENTPMWTVVRRRIQRGAHISTAHYQQVIAQREAIYTEFAASLPQHACLLLPIVPSLAPVLNAEDTSCQAIGPYSRPFNYLDVPACSFPIGYAAQQQPIAAQLVMLKGQEPLLLDTLHQLMSQLKLHGCYIQHKKIPT